MSDPPTPEPGQKWVRHNTHYTILAVTDDTVTMQTGPNNHTVEETYERFTEEAAAGRAVLHPDCDHCGLPTDPDEARDGPLHYECWFEHATVRERCEAEVDRPGSNRIAAEALRADTNPRDHLLDLIGNPARNFHDRTDAEHLLSGAIPVSDLLDATARCPTCREEEYFDIHPTTGAVHCHCGEQLKPPDSEEPAH